MSGTGNNARTLGNNQFAFLVLQIVIGSGLWDHLASGGQSSPMVLKMLSNIYVYEHAKERARARR